MTRSDAGTFTVSLDFELFWGVHDKVSLSSYGPNILGGREAIPQTLELFAELGVHATWATVGLLFFEERGELEAHLPDVRPEYTEPAFSPYRRIGGVGCDERDDPFHFGLSLVRRILDCPGQEIGTHTFSHYYCLEDGQNIDAFRSDLAAARAAAQRIGVSLRSLVFPRNQINAAYLEVCRDAGIIAVRGNRDSWLFRARPDSEERIHVRACRLLDQYAPIARSQDVTPTVTAPGIVDIPASRFMRPVSRRLRSAEQLRLRRIMGGMTSAAEAGTVYHLWWHPHNFGGDVNANLDLLRRVLQHYSHLALTHGFRSQSMAEVAEAVLAT